MKNTLLASVLLALLSTITPARAAIIDVIWQGLATGGFRGSGPLYDVPYATRYRIDTSLGRVFPLGTDGATLLGGTFEGFTSPIVSISFYILGRVFSTNINYYSAYQYGAVTTGNKVIASALSASTEEIGVGISGNSGLAPVGVFTEFYYPEKHTFALLPLASDTYSGFFIYNDASDIGFALYLKDTSVTIDPISAGVPEPATWAMMITGFAMLTWAARRRRITAREHH